MSSPARPFTLTSSKNTPPSKPTTKKAPKALPAKPPKKQKKAKAVDKPAKKNKLELAQEEAATITDWQPKTDRQQRERLGQTKASHFFSSKGVGPGSGGILKDRDSIYQNLAALAGYLGFDTTHALRGFIRSNNVARIYTAWTKVRERNWGLESTGKGKTAEVKLANIWMYIRDRNSSERALFQLLTRMPDTPAWTEEEMRQTLEVTENTSSETLLPTFITLHAMMHMVMRNPEVFRDSRQNFASLLWVPAENDEMDTGPPPLEWDFDEEDLLRASTLILAISNHMSKDKTITDKTDIAEGFARGNIATAIPVYYYDADFAKAEQARKDASSTIGPRESTKLSNLLGGEHEQTLKEAKISCIKAGLDPDQPFSGNPPSEREARQAKSILKKIYGPSMQKITTLRRLRAGPEQLDTLNAIYGKADFIVNTAAHLSNNEDLPDLGKLDEEYTRLKLQAAVRFGAGEGAEADTEAQPTDPVQPKSQAGQDPAAVNADLAKYQAKVLAVQSAREKRRLEIRSFKKNMEETRLISVRTDGYLSACHKLALNPDRPVIGTAEDQVPLKPWQVTGLSYLLNDVPEDLRAHILSDDCGLGKTLLTLELEARYKEKEIAKHNSGEPADLRPSIIWCPANIMNVWLKEYERLYQSRFKLRVYAWSAATMSSSDPRFKFMIGHEELAKELMVPGGSLHHDNPDAVRTTILCPYQTWSLRTLISKAVYEAEVGRWLDDIKSKQQVSRSIAVCFGAPQNASFKRWKNLLCLWGTPKRRRKGFNGFPFWGSPKPLANRARHADTHRQRHHAARPLPPSTLPIMSTVPISPLPQSEALHPTIPRTTTHSFDDIDDVLLRAQCLATASLMKTLLNKPSTIKVSRAKARAARAAKQSRTNVDDEEDEDELSDEDEAEAKKQDQHDEDDYISLVAGRFSRGYCDEAHLIKNRRTVTNLSIRLAKLRFILLTSATPAPNRITDFLVYLELIQPDDVEDNDAWLNTVTTPDAAVEYYKNPAVHMNVKLNPAMFRFLCSNNDMHLVYAYEVLPIILGYIQLKRSIGETMDIGTPEEPRVITIGDDIPVYSMFHILVEPRPMERLDFGQTFTTMAPLLSGGGASHIEGSGERGSRDVEDSGSLNLHAIRRLMQGSFCPSLERLSREYGVKANVDGILQTSHSDDHGKRPHVVCKGCVFWGTPKTSIAC